MIDGVLLTPLKQIVDERGAILHMLRNDSDAFEQFGEIYFSMVNPGVVKGWHIHDRMTLNYAVPIGTIKAALYDGREGSKTHGALMEIYLGERNYQLLTVPPGVWNGFKGLGAGPSLVANCATLPHDPAEIHRMDPMKSHIPYNWALVHG